MAAYQPNAKRRDHGHTRPGPRPGWCQSSWAWPDRKRGRAHIEAEGAGLAGPLDVHPAAPGGRHDQEPASRPGPPRLRAATATPSGTAPTTTMAMAATPSSSRSAGGSSTLPSRRDLVEMAGHVAVDAVGDPEPAEQEGGGHPARPIRLGQQPHEQRDAEQANHGEAVGHGEDAVLPSPSRQTHGAKSRSVGGQTLGTALGVGPVSSPKCQDSVPRLSISTTWTGRVVPASVTVHTKCQPARAGSASGQCTSGGLRVPSWPGCPGRSAGRCRSRPGGRAAVVEIAGAERQRRWPAAPPWRSAPGSSSPAGGRRCRGRIRRAWSRRRAASAACRCSRLGHRRQGAAEPPAGGPGLWPTGWRHTSAGYPAPGSNAAATWQNGARR